MNSKELMIGDWAIFNGNPLKVQAIDSRDSEIVAGDGIFCTEESRWAYTADKVEGIPLTPEILEKNGWKRHEIFMDMKADENINFSWTDMYGESLFQNGYHMCDCKYVHTLQHVLRLYRLDELADNFKL